MVATAAIPRDLVEENSIGFVVDVPCAQERADRPTEARRRTSPFRRLGLAWKSFSRVRRDRCRY